MKPTAENIAAVAGVIDDSMVLPTVLEITGRQPRSFRQWAKAHADMFHHQPTEY